MNNRLFLFCNKEFAQVKKDKKKLINLKFLKNDQIAMDNCAFHEKLV